MNQNYQFDKLIKDINKRGNQNLTILKKEQKILENFVKNYTFPRCDQLAYNIHMRYYKENQNIRKIKESITNTNLSDNNIKQYINNINNILCSHLIELQKRIKTNQQDEYARFQCLYMGSGFTLAPLTKAGIFTKRDLIDFIHENYQTDTKTSLTKSIPNIGDKIYQRLDAVFKEEYNSSIQDTYDAIYNPKTEEKPIDTISDNELIDLMSARFGLKKEQLIKQIEKVKQDAIIKRLNEISRPLELNSWIFDKMANNHPTFHAIKPNEYTIYLEYQDKWKLWFKYMDENYKLNNNSHEFSKEALIIYQNLLDFMEEERNE